MQEGNLMNRLHNRRSLLKNTLGGITALAMPAGLFAQSDEFKQLSNRITLLSNEGVNQLALDVGDGIVLVDSGPEVSSGLLLNTLDSLNQGSVHTVGNNPGTLVFQHSIAANLFRMPMGIEHGMNCTLIKAIQGIQ